MCYQVRLIQNNEKDSEPTPKVEKIKQQKVSRQSLMKRD